MAAGWAGSVLLYAGLTAAGDAAQRRGRGQPPDWAQTRRVALLALTFHGNLNYVWLRALERALPGRRPAAVLGKVLCDQLLAAPVAVGAFYTGEWLCGAPGRPIAERQPSAAVREAGPLSGLCPALPHGCVEEKHSALPSVMRGNLDSQEIRRNFRL